MTLDRMDLLVNVLDSTFDKESWYAPLKDAVEGITAEQARWKPSGEAAKSIWENVNHLIYYKERLAAKLQGSEWTNNLDGDETFLLTEPSTHDEHWNKVVERAMKANASLRNLLDNYSIDELTRH